MKFFSLILFLLIAAPSFAADAGTEKLNPDETFQKILPLAEHGDVDAQYYVGMLYNNGIGTDKDPQKAFEWFTKAAAANQHLAEYKLGNYYAGQFADVIAPDEEKRLHYLVLSSLAGYDAAQYDLAMLYRKKDNYGEAAKWLKISADQGFPQAMNVLAQTYYIGEDDPTHANVYLSYAYLKLYLLAKDGTIKDIGQQSLDAIASKLSKADLEKAEAYAAQWKPNPTDLTRKAHDGLTAYKKLLAKAR